jgi:hypothetical protein
VAGGVIGLAVLAAGALRKATVPEFVANGDFPLSEMPAPDADSFKVWLDRRATLETLLQLNVTPGQQLQASLFILARCSRR